MYICILGLNINISMHASIFINTEACAVSQHNHLVAHKVKAEKERENSCFKNFLLSIF